VAALKPDNCGIPAYTDHARSYLEIAVLRLVLRGEARAARVIELVHRAVPYPVFLVNERGSGSVEIAVAEKRDSRAEIGKAVLDGGVVEVAIDSERDAAWLREFEARLALSRNPRGSLYALYRSWLNLLIAFAAARLMGRFDPDVSDDQAAARREALNECSRLDGEIDRTRAGASRENQMARRVALNLELTRMRAARASAVERL